jgi:hypothetical protein
MEPHDPHHPLNRYTTDELLAILGARFDALLFIGCQPKTKSAQDMTFCSVGQFHSCIGLVECARMLLTAGGVED